MGALPLAPKQIENMKHLKLFLSGWIAVALLTSCISGLAQQNNGIEIDSTSLTQGACSGTFVADELDHTTSINSQTIEMFESNGAGVAINDLDKNGYLDLVFGNLGGPNTVFWNEGDLQFSAQSIGRGTTRAVNIIDVDGDTWLDIVFTKQMGAPVYWKNEGDREFTTAELVSVDELAYSLNWADMDGDGDLDLVTAGYDAELERTLGNGFMFGDGAGVFYYENLGEEFESTRLSEQSQALAVFLGDLNSDDQPDILVGNDFAVPDFVWLQTADGWEQSEIFSQTTHSTMSFDAGDINNDGLRELFATDMHPYSTEPDMVEAWQPVMDMMEGNAADDNVQTMENTLQSGQGSSPTNVATDYGLAATGWSWSGKFGDLNQDGFVDVYVVNGMAASELFGAQPNSELVEENQAFQNLDGTGFMTKPEWNLASTSGGRGMSMADLDNDGDLDIVVNNLLAPAQVFENQLCEGQSLQIELAQQEQPNVYGIGSQLILHTDAGPYYRQLDAASGYLSGNSTRVHFGLPEGTEILHLEITWPDGETSIVKDVSPNSFIRITKH